MELKGSETEKNLLKSFAGESQARNRYTYFASVARKEGYRQIEAIFLETADNEKEHAKAFFKHLEGGMVEIAAKYPAGTISDTLSNLEASASGEYEEWAILYPEAAKIAEEEGFAEVARLFAAIAKVEAEHEKRYRKLIENLKGGTVFKKSASVKWKCRNCGFIHNGESAPANCPACAHPQAHFEVTAENY